MKPIWMEYWIPLSLEDGIAPESQVVDGQWYVPKFGCDTLQHMIDELVIYKESKASPM
jgi:hypothetical protein